MDFEGVKLQMKKLVKVEEIAGEGLLALLGENVLIFGVNYIYAGKLVGVNDTCILLENGGIVYETGDFNNKSYKDFQKVSDQLYVQLGAIEAFSRGKE